MLEPTGPSSPGLNFSPLCTTCTTQALVERSNEEFPLRSAPRIKYLVSILYCFSTHQKLYRENERESKLHRREISSIDSFRIDARDLPSQRTCPSSTTATADCSRPSLQLFRQARTSIHQYCIYSYGSRSSLQLQRQARNFPLRYCLYCHSSRPSLQLP